MKMPNLFMPGKLMNNHGNFVGSLGCPLARLNRRATPTEPRTTATGRHWLPGGLPSQLGGSEVHVLVRTRKAAELAARIPAKTPPDTSKFLLSPMPGLIISIPVRAGEPVKAGQELWCWKR